MDGGERGVCGVGRRLGLGPGGHVWWEDADACWPGWQAGDARLAAVGSVAALPGWLRAAAPDAADGVLHALAGLGARHGGDQVAAAAVLAFALLPGAAALARRLADLSPRIDDAVAAELWLQVRGFPFQRRRRVAANVLADVRRGVLREVGWRGALPRSDRAWARATVLDPQAPFWTAAADATADVGVAPLSSAEELWELLAWGCERGGDHRR